MERDKLLGLFQQVATGALSPAQALNACCVEPFARTIGAVHLDRHRALRTGLGEVVYGRGKSDEQLRDCIAGLAQDGRAVLATRLERTQCSMLSGVFPAGEAWPEAGLFALNARQSLRADWPAWPAHGQLMVVTAGASDQPVALEALGTARFLGLSPGFVPDVGVAGLHRLQPHLDALCAAELLIVAAGMEGALPSVLGGLCPRPIIAVPTSVGYGACFQGLAALLAMLNSCAPGVAVVNIDNGFGAAVLAARLLQRQGAGAHDQ